MSALRSQQALAVRRPLALPLIGAGALLAVQIGLLGTRHLLIGDFAAALLVAVLLTVGNRSASPSVLAALRALAVVAVLPVLALGLPLGKASVPAGTFVLAGLVLAIWFAASPVIGINRSPAFSLKAPFIQLSLVLVGTGLGFLAYLAGAPRGWAPHATTAQIVLDGAALAAIGVVEELIFRWLLQGALQRIAPRLGLLLAIALSAAVYVGSGPPSLVIVMAIAAAGFSFAVDRTGSAVGAILGRIGLVLGAGFGGPLLIGAVGIAVLHFPRWRGWEGIASLAIWLVLVTVVAVRGAKGRASKGQAVS
jgi:membrane protease YdiL (CAAX protease family)